MPRSTARLSAVDMKQEAISNVFCQKATHLQTKHCRRTDDAAVTLLLFSLPSWTIAIV